MRCPYHPHQPARISTPEATSGADEGWIGWLEGCCSLPAWRCPHGDLHPADAAFCTFHGCPRPPLSRVAHEVAWGPRGMRDATPPSLLERTLEVPPQTDGRSTPALAGNVLVYLARDGRVVAIDLGGNRHIVLVHDVDVAAMRLVGGEVVAALQSRGSVRYLAWSVADLRDALVLGVDDIAATASTATTVHLLGLPLERTRLHQGAGMLRLVVEHDPVPDEMAELYEAVTGCPPGPWLVRRTPNPAGPRVPHADLRPQTLHQVPIPVPGGVFLIGQVRWFGRNIDGALLIPTVTAPGGGRAG